MSIMCNQAASNFMSYNEIYDRILEVSNIIHDAFENASREPKITDRNELISFNSSPLVDYNIPPQSDTISNRKQVMRKQMNDILRTILSQYNECIYFGEDVTHGGYYLVTENLVNEFPLRIRDFPPDETSLMGVAVGYAQCGLLPIVEIPYAKYLDCASDMFFEACIMNWLTKGQQPNGMIIRLQGFGTGIFGGNFHTHNLLHIPPGYI